MILIVDDDEGVIALHDMLNAVKQHATSTHQS